jgi:hypothetical protein
MCYSLIISFNPFDQDSYLPYTFVSDFPFMLYLTLVCCFMGFLENRFRRPIYAVFDA